MGECCRVGKSSRCLPCLQVIEPQVKAYLYTWGEGRNTAEGEHIPVRIESLDIGYIDGQLLLPLIEEHTIDERSPLCGHTYMSLKSVSVVAAALHVDTVPPAPVAAGVETEVNSCFAGLRAYSAIHINTFICCLALIKAQDCRH